MSAKLVYKKGDKVIVTDKSNIGRKGDIGTVVRDVFNGAFVDVEFSKDEDKLMFFCSEVRKVTKLDKALK